MSRHTPGPWRYNERMGVIVSNQSHPVAELSAHGHRLLHDGSVGNDGPLIAAAPDLLAALNRVLGTVEHVYHTHPDPDGSLWDDVLACRAAIEKATTQHPEGGDGQ